MPQAQCKLLNPNTQARGLESNAGDCLSPKATPGDMAAVHARKKRTPPRTPLMTRQTGRRFCGHVSRARRLRPLTTHPLPWSTACKPGITTPDGRQGRAGTAPARRHTGGRLQALKHPDGPRLSWSCPVSCPVEVFQRASKLVPLSVLLLSLLAFPQSGKPLPVGHLAVFPSRPGLSRTLSRDSPAAHPLRGRDIPPSL